MWAIAVSEDGRYLASTSYDGRILVWDIVANGAKIREFETKGSFGMAIDLASKKPHRANLSLTSIAVNRWKIHSVRAREWQCLHL